MCLSCAGMAASTPPALILEKPLSREMRLWLLADTVLVLVTGVQLFVLAEDTDRFFAWTITPPLTAAFLGAAYWASLPLVFLSSSQRGWARARLAVVGVLVFTTLTLVATLIHLDRFHLGGSDPVATGAAWAWLAVYVAVPPLLLGLLIAQLRVPGAEPPRRSRLPAWLRAALSVQATVLLVLGACLLIVPVSVPWPWPLTALTGRAIGAWLVGIGVIAGHAVWENDFERVRPTMYSYLILGLLETLTLERDGRRLSAQ